jgi:folate-binding protein YgfZ
MKIATFDWHKSKGASFEDFFGVEIPSQYGNIEKEYRALRESVGMRDVSYFGKIRVAGKDYRRYLQGKITNDIELAQPGKGILATALDIKGHIQADMKIYGFPDYVLMVLQHYARDPLMAFLDRYIISEDVSMKDVSTDFGMIQLIGPAAQGLLKQKGVTEYPDDLYSFREIEITGHKIQLIRLGAGYAILCQAADTAALLDSIDAQPVGMQAFNIFRVEEGLGLFKRDFDESNLPQEARLDAALNFQKGCYLGQEVMARLDAQGHINKQLMGVTAKQEFNSGDPIFKEDREVGKVMSVVRSIKLNQPLALAYVRREVAKEGESVEIGGPRTAGTVKNLPVSAD